MKFFSTTAGVVSCALLILGAVMAAKKWNGPPLHDDRRVVERAFTDSASPQFRNERTYISDGGRTLVCGEVNAKNAAGEYTGFKRYISERRGSGGKAIIDNSTNDKAIARFQSIWLETCKDQQRTFR
jgi:hypothetical protein